MIESFALFAALWDLPVVVMPKLLDLLTTNLPTLNASHHHLPVMGRIPVSSEFCASSSE